MQIVEVTTGELIGCANRLAIHEDGKAYLSDPLKVELLFYRYPGDQGFKQAGEFVQLIIPEQFVPPGPCPAAPDNAIREITYSDLAKDVTNLVIDEIEDRIGRGELDDVGCRSFDEIAEKVDQLLLQSVSEFSPGGLSFSQREPGPRRLPR